MIADVRYAFRQLITGWHGRVLAMIPTLRKEVAAVAPEVTVFNFVLFEIGIRIALGATHGAVQRLVVGQGMKCVAIGLFFGIAGALVASRILTATLFGISGNDLVSYGVACSLLALTAVIAALIPARRACLVSPREALRTE